MLDSGVRLAAASLPVGVPVVVGLVVAVLRRRDLPAVSTPAIAGLAVQLVVVLISTFLVAATSFGAGLTPETLLPLSSVLGFVVILLQVVSWTLLLIALFRRLPGTKPQREDRTPTGRHALLDDRGHQVVAEAGTTFLPVGAAAGAGAGLGAAAAAGTRGAPDTGPRPVTGPPPGPPQGPSQSPFPGAPQGPLPGPPRGMPPGPPPGSGPGDPGSSPLPSIPRPDRDASGPGREVPGRGEPARGEPGRGEPDQGFADTETFAAYGTPAPTPDAGDRSDAADRSDASERDDTAVETHGTDASDETDAAPEAPESVAAGTKTAGTAGTAGTPGSDGAAGTDAGPDGEPDPVDGRDAADAADDGDAAEATTTEHPGYLAGASAPAAGRETPPGEDVDEEPVADADTDPADTPEGPEAPDTTPDTARDTGSADGTSEDTAATRVGTTDSTTDGTTAADDTRAGADDTDDTGDTGDTGDSAGSTEESAEPDSGTTGEVPGPEPASTGNGASASGGHPWFDPDGEAARSQPERR